MPPEGVLPASPATPPERYTVSASVLREGPGGTTTRLAPGDRLSVGDRLSLEIRASRSLHVYVVNEDERGHAYALFPHPDLETTNPLPPDSSVMLPGRWAGGNNVSWEVTTAGGREHLLIVASPEPQIEFEAELDALPRPAPGALAMALSEGAKLRLRGLGGLAESERAGPPADAGRIFAMARRLAGDSETVEGAWVRQIELLNPEP